ncbi:hypothetical protein ACXR2U_12835 [Jatrophihabitans sp. YIM 134969]
MSSPVSGTPDPRIVEVLPARVTLGEGDGRAGGTGGERPRATVFTGEVGEFRRGDAASRWALARYLVARTIGDGAVRALLGVAVLFAVLTVVLAVLSAPVVLTVLCALVALGWFGGWRLARALWSRLSGGPALAPVRHELDRLVGETRPDVRRELRRLGLPAHPLAAFAFARRLGGRRRSETTAKMREFDVDRVVPADRVDRVVLLLERVETTPV